VCQRNRIVFSAGSRWGYCRDAEKAESGEPIWVTAKAK
jgi:hypothetical protein